MCENPIASVHARPETPVDAPSPNTTSPRGPVLARARVPLTQHLSPLAHLVRDPTGSVRWWVRWPDEHGAPTLRAFRPEQLEAWAAASQLPGLAAELHALVEGVA